MIAMAAFAVIATAGWAQFERGTKYVGASVSGLSLSYSKASDFSFGLDATGGYYIADSWMLKGNLGYNHKKSYDGFTLGAAARYNFLQNGIYLEAGLEYQFDDFGKKTVTLPTEVDGAIVEVDVSKNDRKNNLRLPINIGYTFYLNQHIAIEPAIYTKLSLNDFNDGTEFGLKLGLGYYF